MIPRYSSLFSRGSLFPTLLAVAVFATSAAEPALTPLKTVLPVESISRVEQELARLNAEADKMTDPNYPRMAHQVAYLLLAGLAAQGSTVDNLSEAERLQFRIEKHAGQQGKLVEISPDVRIALADNWIQDKSGTYI